MFITGPEVIRVTTGEAVSFDSLGGAEVHNVKSGVAHFLAQSEDEGFEQTRHRLPSLPKRSPDGRPVGVGANQPKGMAGAPATAASVKAARFVRFCDAFNVPLVVLEDVPGFLPGAQQEYGGIIRHGAKLLYAFSEATVPKLTVITRKAYGGAYCVMCSKHIRADYNAAWPTAEVAVMGPEGAVNVIFRREIESSPNPADRRAELVADYVERFANPYIAAERGYIDDVIEPGRTRGELIRALRIALRKERRRSPRWHGNIPL